MPASEFPFDLDDFWASLRIPDRITWNDVPGELALFDGFNYFLLGGTGSDIWRCLAQRRSIHDVAAELAAKYGADPVGILRDILEFARQGLSDGVLVQALQPIVSSKHALSETEQ